MSVSARHEDIASACYWLARGPHEAQPPLSGRRDADVAIVGGGLTGLWTALHLKRLEPRTEVVVVEKERSAYGGSGRNAGMLADTLDHSHALAVAHFGHDEAVRLARLGRENLAEMLGFVVERGIECDLERTGLLQVALNASHLAALRQAESRARSLGVTGLRLLDAEQARAEIHCELYQGALFKPGCAVLDPAKLVAGLAREARGAGVALYERTPVVAMEHAGAGVRLTCPGGEVRARRVILATGAWSHHLFPGLLWRFIPLYDYVLASEPLSAAQRDRIGWRGRQGVTDVRAFFKYYRLTADDRVVWGTSEAAYHAPNRVDPGCDHSESHYQALRDSFARHFPGLDDLEFPYAWGGPIDATTRFTPFFGARWGGRVLYGLGFTGQGLGSTHLAGKVLAHLALERSHDVLELAMVRRRPLPYPPEPVRSWAVRRVTRDLRNVDAGGSPSLLLHLLDALGVGLSS